MEIITTSLSGLSITVVGLCLLRTWRSRSWGSLYRLPRLRDKTLDGQVIVVTGANTGLGYKTAEDLALRGASSVVLACRNLSKGTEAAMKIKESTGNQNVECLMLDLSSLENIRHFAHTIKQKFGQIDILVCNAGVWIPMNMGAKTEDNFEAHVGTNHLGHFLLTNLLLSHGLQRIVVVSSGLMMHGVVDVDDSRQFLEGRKLKPTDKVPSHAPVGYCDSKLMNGLFVSHLAKRLKEQGRTDVTLVSVCPGWCKTNLARHVPMPWYKKMLLAPIALLFMRSSTQGAQNIIYAVVEDSDKLKSGGLYRDFRLAEKENQKIDSLEEQVGLKLWQLSEEMTQEKQ